MKHLIKNCSYFCVVLWDRKLFVASSVYSDNVGNPAHYGLFLH